MVEPKAYDAEIDRDSRLRRVMTSSTFKLHNLQNRQGRGGVGVEEGGRESEGGERKGHGERDSGREKCIREWLIYS